MSLTNKNSLVKKTIALIESDSVSIDVVKMRESNFFTLYNQNKTHCLREDYLYDNIIWQAKQLILQLKLGVSHVTFKGKVAKPRCLEKMYVTAAELKTCITLCTCVYITNPNGLST